MRGQPRLHGCRLPAGQQVHHAGGGDVHQDGPVHVPLAQREVIDPGHLRRPGGLGRGEGLDQAEHGGGVHGDPQEQGQPGAGAPGQLQPEPGQHRRQRHAAPAVTAGHALGLLHERDRRAPRLQAAEPAYLQGDQHRAAAGRAVGHHPRIPALHPGGLLPAPRAARRPRPARRRDHHRLAGVRHPVHPQPRQMREHHDDQGLVLRRDFPGTGSGGRPGRRHTGRPLARCPPERVLFQRPPVRTTRVPFDARGSPVTTPWMPRLAAVRGWPGGRECRPRGSSCASGP